MIPRVVLVGGWEFVKDDGIDERIAELAKGKAVFIPDASNFPEKQIARAVEKYRQYDTEVILLEPGATKIPDSIKVVYLGGGQPEKLMEYFSNHPELLDDIKAKWLNQEIILAGSSTGAMVMFKEMIALGSRGRGDTKLTLGLGFIKNDAVAIPHWNEPDGSQEWRDRFLAAHNEKLLITIDEYTALFWGDAEAKVVGLGAVNIVDGGKMDTYTNGQIVSGLELLT